MMCTLSDFADRFLRRVMLSLCLAATLVAFETATHPPSSLALMLLQWGSIHNVLQCRTCSKLYDKAQNICWLLAVKLLLRPFITSKEKLCLFDIKCDNSIQIALVCKTTLPRAYLTLPGASRGTSGRRANLKVSTVYFSIWIHFTFFLWGCRSERSEAIEWEAWGEGGTAQGKLMPFPPAKLTRITWKTIWVSNEEGEGGPLKLAPSYGLHPISLKLHSLQMWRLAYRQTMLCSIATIKINLTAKK